MEVAKRWDLAGSREEGGRLVQHRDQRQAVLILKRNHEFGHIGHQIGSANSLFIWLNQKRTKIGFAISSFIRLSKKW